uniref:F-box domain-containing protein n=1 Tax=Parastrongyloides trichosuri TaxID=131310 RepID=A0A0N4Z815_PARTI
MDSLSNATSLITSSLSTYTSSLSKTQISKTVDVCKNTLFIQHNCSVLDGDGTLKDILVDWRDVILNTTDLLTYFTKYKTFLEHVYSIHIFISDDEETKQSQIIDSFSQRMATFIDELFMICPNATSLTFNSYSSTFFFIIPYLSSPSINILKLNFSKYVYGHYLDKISKLKNVLYGLNNLKVVYLDIACVPSILETNCQNLINSMLEYLSGKLKNRFILNTKFNKDDIKYVKNFLKYAHLYDVNIGLQGTLNKNDSFFSFPSFSEKNDEIFETKNIVELNISVNDLDGWTKLFDELPNFENLKVFKVSLNSNSLKYDSMNNEESVLSRYFNNKRLKNISNLDEFYFQLSRFFYFNGTYEEKEKFYILVDLIVDGMISNLNSKLKVMYLDGIPNLNDEMKVKLNTNCPNITSIHLGPINSIAVDFIENLEKLKFVQIVGNFKINIPSNVDILIFNSGDFHEHDDYKMIGEMNSTETDTYFRDKYNRNFNVSIKNCDDYHFRYAVLCDNILTWNAYLDKLRKFDNAFILMEEDS